MNRVTSLASGILLAAFSLLPAGPAAAVQIDLSLNVLYNNPLNNNSGGTWQLVAKSDGQGISFINAYLQEIGNPSAAAPRGTVNGSDDAGFYLFESIATCDYTSIFVGQSPIIPLAGDEQTLFYGVGTLSNGAPNYPGKPAGTNSIGPAFTSLSGVQNVPWAPVLTAASPWFPFYAGWETGAVLATGTFGTNLQPAFFCDGPECSFGSIYTAVGSSTVGGAESNFQTTPASTIVRTNLENVGDYNGNGVVDAADYTIWRDTLGSTADLRADGSGNGTTDQADYDLWVTKFGTVAGSGSAAAAAVPEPATWFGFALFAAAGFLVRKK